MGETAVLVVTSVVWQTRQDGWDGGSDMWWGWICMQVDPMYTYLCQLELR